MIHAVTDAIPMLAYLGPGGALSGIGAILALAGAVLLAIVGFVWYPLKRWLRARKAARADDATPAHEDQKA